MNKLRKIFLCALVGVGLAGCSSVQPSGDDNLRQAVMERLQQDDLVQRQLLSVSVQDGVVTLHGVIHDEGVRMRAISLTQSTPGVNKPVQDQMIRR